MLSSTTLQVSSNGVAVTQFWDSSWASDSMKM